MEGNLPGNENHGLSGNHNRNDEDFVSLTSTQDTLPLRDLLPLPKKENTIMSAFVEAGLTSMMPLLSFKPDDQVDKTDSDEEKDRSLLRSMSMSKERMNKKMRVVQKAGLTNVLYKNISKKRRRYFSDLYTTLLDATWCQGVLLFSACFFTSWFLFASFYYFLAFVHGDLAERSNIHIPCILGIDGFLSSFLFSLETQHTIGYGTRAVTTECVDVVLVAAVQCVFGLLLQAVLLGLIFSKLSKPRMRTKTVMFSRCAVINQRDRRLCLIFRIGDLRDDNFILGTQITAKVLRRRVTAEGEIYQDIQMIKVEPNSSQEPCIFFVWPLEIVHVIDQDSPFYELSAFEFANQKFELVAIMEGTSETSSMTFQAKTSYLPSEIYWGHRFEGMTLYRKDNKKYQVNFAAFHSTYEVDTPSCSAKELDMLHSEKT